MFNKALNHLEEILISFLMAAATLVIFVAVVHRYLAGVPYIQDLALKIHMKSTDYVLAMQRRSGAASMDAVAIGGPNGGQH